MGGGGEFISICLIVDSGTLTFLPSSERNDVEWSEKSLSDDFG